MNINKQEFDEEMQWPFLLPNEEYTNNDHELADSRLTIINHAPFETLETLLANFITNRRNENLIEFNEQMRLEYNQPLLLEYRPQLTRRHTI